MIPRVRLKYVQGLATTHDELRLPRDVDLTTDGQQLVISSAASGRPLVKLPLTAVQKTEILPKGGPATATNKAAAGLMGNEGVIVLQLGVAPGVPAVVADQPIVFADAYDEDVTPRFKTLKDVLVPRTPEEMALLAKGESRIRRGYAIVFMVIVLILVFIIVAIQQLIAGPKPRDAYAPVQLAAASVLLEIGD